MFKNNETNKQIDFNQKKYIERNFITSQCLKPERNNIVLLNAFV